MSRTLLFVRMRISTGPGSRIPIPDSILYNSRCYTIFSVYVIVRAWLRNGAREGPLASRLACVGSRLSP